MTIRHIPRRSVLKILAPNCHIQAPPSQRHTLKSWFVQSLIRPHFQPEHNMPEHCWYSHPSACIARGDIHDVHVPLLLLPSGTTKATGNHQAWWFFNALWPKWLNTCNKKTSFNNIDLLHCMFGGVLGLPAHALIVLAWLAQACLDSIRHLCIRCQLKKVRQATLGTKFNSDHFGIRVPHHAGIREV